MKDINCPYCDAELDICHDDGFGYEEGVKDLVMVPAGQVSLYVVTEK